MKKAVFVILHYITIQDTIEAVESIKNHCEMGNCRIIIVDNGSGNNTGKELSDLYSADPYINVIISNQNVGFARGNNIGIRFARSHYDPDFIILINNDILIVQHEFLNTIVDEYYNSHFAVLGPKIKTADGKYDSSPVFDAPITSSEVESMIKEIRKEYIADILYLYDLLKKSLNLIRKNINRNDIKEDNTYEYNDRMEDVVLHGCCLILSRDYVETIGILDESTFLYCEEQILYLTVKRHGLKIVYNPELEVFHKEDSSTNAVCSNERKKRLFMNKHLLQSGKQLLRVCRENGV